MAKKSSKTADDMASDSGTASYPGVASSPATSSSPATLRQRATTIQVIGAPSTDRSAQRQQRLGFSLLLGLALGWDSLMVAASSTAPFHTAIGRFLLIFGATVGSIRALGNLYDSYLDEADVNQRKLDAARRDVAGASTIVNTDQPAT